MAVVASGRTPNGAHYRIFDDAYINNTPEENERLKMRACEIAYEILCSIARDKLNHANEEKNLSPT